MVIEPPWWKNSVIYELYVDKFADNFSGLTSKLDYFAKLGVGCLWILPHYPSPLVDGGYDISNFKDVRNDLGTLKDFRSFIEHAHKRGLRVVTDLVLNHTSSEHPWFQEARRSKNSPKRNYYLWSETGKEFASAENPFKNIKPANWIPNPETDDYYYATFYPQQPDLNWDNPEVFDEMASVMSFWMDMGVDGFRLDAVPRLVKREGTDCVGLPEVHTIIKRIRNYIDRKYKDKILLAETDQQPQEAAKYFGDGDECHIAFHFLLATKLWLSIKRNDPTIAEKVVEETPNIPKNCQWATFLGNHDAFALYMLNRKERLELGRWLDPKCKFSVRPGTKTSMRLAEVFEGDRDNILRALAALFRLPGTPVIYYGDEIGMRNVKLKTKPRDTRDYVRGQFNWREAERQVNDPDSIFNRTAKLISRWKRKRAEAE